MFFRLLDFYCCGSCSSSTMQVQIKDIELRKLNKASSRGFSKFKRENEYNKQMVR